MDARITAELLYESEATLRMVDDALDELRLADSEPLSSAPRLTVVAGAEEAVDDSDFAVRMFWQVQETLDGVRDSRERLQALRRCGTVGVHDTETGRSGLDRALALVDRLATLEGEVAGERERLQGDLRRELMDLSNRSERRGGAMEELNEVALQLAEAEVRLARLGHLFESTDG